MDAVRSSSPPKDEGVKGPKTESKRGASARLRSASRKSKNAGNKANRTSSEAHARECHNVVEKHYRNRLNANFAKLLAVLPPAQIEKHGAKFDPNGCRCLSKGQVLDAARDHIVELEKEIESETVIRDALLRNLETFERRWAELNRGSQ